MYFLFDRALLKELSKIAWEVFGLYYKNAVSKENIKPAAISSIQAVWRGLPQYPQYAAVPLQGHA